VRNGIIFIHSSDERYGADRMLLEMIAALPPEQPFEVWLPSDLDHVRAPLCELLIELGAPVRHVNLPIMRRAYRTPRGLAGLAWRELRLLRRLLAARPELVYCTTSAAFLAAPVARLARVPKVVGHVQEIWSPADRKVLSSFARACQLLLAISAPVVAALPESLRARTQIIDNGTPEPAQVSSLAGRAGPLRYVVASRWNSWKGYPTLLAAWDRLAEPGQLVVLGGRPPVGEWVDVPLLVSQLAHPESVTVVGEVSDPARHIADADVMLIPSDDPEPFGLVAIEAFARARPVIGSDAGGLAGIITDGQDGWLFPPRDVDALAGLLDRLDRSSVTAAGRAARETYEQRFTTEKFQQRWRGALQLNSVDEIAVPH
jgi:glycosyltransferase involved in cell wall biosynthesis